jgi:hypothetical protein
MNLFIVGKKKDLKFPCALFRGVLLLERIPRETCCFEDPFSALCLFM